MNLAEKSHQDADSAVSSVHRRSPVFRIRKPFLSKFITASSGSTQVGTTLPLTFRVRLDIDGMATVRFIA
jgi:hypothetical protein